MVNIFNILEIYNKISPLSETQIYSKLQGYIKVVLDYKEKIIREITTNTILYNQYGKVFDSGECLLFPNRDCSDWNDFIKKLVIEEHEKELVEGEVCLVKRSYTDPWILAIYHQKVENDYQARVGKEFEFFKYCISFKTNTEYLGRESFPSWFNIENDNP